jgi:hypothetical protein
MHDQYKKREEELLDKALQVFKKTTGLNMIAEEIQRKELNYARYDAILNLKTEGFKKQFAAEIKERLNAPALGPIIHQLKQYHPKGILVTDYVNPNMAEKLKEEKIPFIDTAGNVYLNEPPIFVYVKGNRPDEKRRKIRLKRVFQPTGLKILFALLCKPHLVNAPYREIAEEANVALGTVGWVFTDLRNMGFLMDMGKHGRRFADKKKLLDAWVIMYPERLRPKIILGRYAGPTPNWYKNTNLYRYDGLWGGEVGAEKLTNFLRPEIITIYIQTEDKETILDNKINKFLIDNKLRKDPKGNIELLKIFWGFKRENLDTVPPLLIYADLLATGDARNLETANMIFENELTRFIKQD